MFLTGKVMKGLGLLAAVLCLALLGGWVLEDDVSTSLAELRPTEGVPLTSNTSARRAFESVTFEKMFELGVDDKVYQPEIVKVDAAGGIYLLDYGDLAVKKFSRDGDAVWSYSPGKGQGPGQFLTPTDIAVSPDGKVWVVDPGTGRLLTLSSTGTLESSKVLEARPYRIARLLENEVVLMWVPPNDRLFARVEKKGGVEHEFGQLLEHQAQDGLVLDGWTAADSSRGFLYASMYLGLVARFDGDSNLIFLSSSLEGGDPPKVLSNGQGRIWLAPETRRRLRSISADREVFHLHADTQVEGERIEVIDTFSSRDGRYLHSWRIPGRTDVAMAQGESLFTVSRGSLTKWRVRAEGEGKGLDTSR